MKILVLIARLILGVAFTVFGLNGFFHFIPMGPMPTGHAGEFVGALNATAYFSFIAGLQLLCGVLFLIGRYIPLALTLIGPVIVNILLYHVTMAPEGIMPGIVVTVLWFVVFAGHRSAFAGLFRR